MDSKDFRELVVYIRSKLEYSYVGLSLQEIQQLNQRLDSDAYSAAIAVEDFFEMKRNETNV